MHVHQERLGFTTVSIFSWSYFIEKSPFDPLKFCASLKNPPQLKNQKWRAAEGAGAKLELMGGGCPTSSRLI